MLVIFDGDCGICQKSVNLLRKLDWFKCFEIQPLQNQKILDSIDGLSAVDCEDELKLVLKDGRIFGGADALIKMSFYIPTVTLLGIIFYLPPMRQLARYIYRKFAANRYRFSSQCSLD